MTTQRKLDDHRLVWQLMRAIAKRQAFDKSISVGHLDDVGRTQLNCFNFGRQRKIVERAIHAAWAAGMFVTGTGGMTATESEVYLTEAAKTLAGEPIPEWRCLKPPVLTERDLDVLGDLASTCKYYDENGAVGRAATPQDVGGTDGSYHSGSLAKLCANGLADCGISYPRPPSIFLRAKGSRRYRITDAGLWAIKHPKHKNR